MNYSDYIIYADESGDPNPAPIDANYPVFVLNFCVFRKDHYAASVLPALAAFKFAHFGHDDVVLHENEIRLQRPPFTLLRDGQTQAHFMTGLDRLVRGADFTIIAAVVDKRQLADQRSPMTGLYELAFEVCIERLRSFLGIVGQQERMAHIVIESRGTKEDRQLGMAFQHVHNAKHSSNTAMPELAIRFADKKTNSAGLQIADLTGRPIGRHFITPVQSNRAWDAIEPKLLRSPQGDVNGWGLTILSK